MYLAYLSAKSYPSTTADHIYIKKIAEALSRGLGERFILVINNDNSQDELVGVGQVLKLSLGRSWRALHFALAFPALYKKLRVSAGKDELIFMGNDKYLFGILGAYQLLGFDFSICSDWHTLNAPLLDRFIVSHSRYATVVTAPLAEILNHRFGLAPQRTLITPNAIDSAIFHSANDAQETRQEVGLPKDKIILGYFGRFKTMGKEKGMTTSLAALAKLDERYFFFAAGGLPAEITEYEALAQKFGVADRVLLKGHATQGELARYERASDILLMPFPDTPHYRSVMSPMKMFEYMASGRPIIASDLPSVRDVLNESNSMLISPATPATLARAIEELASDTERAERLAAAGLDYARGRTWDAKAMEIIHFLSASR